MKVMQTYVFDWKKAVTPECLIYDFVSIVGKSDLPLTSHMAKGVATI